ncbi:MAG TPA: hypothetical protein VF063_09605 [Gaiellaceae bacterium]
MTDADGLLAARFAATRDAYDDSDWSDVLRRKQPRPVTHRRAVLLGVALAAVIAVVALATPLGAAIVHRVGDFSAWLTGEPGSPASKQEQRAFDRANARSWLGFRWLDRREARGQPLDVLPGRDRRLVERHAVFGRVVAPDPSLPIRFALTLSTSRHGGKAIGLCSWLVRAGGMAGGCAVRADLFAKVPFTADMSLVSSDEFETVSGLASDDVSRIEVFFAKGPSLPVPLADNAFVVAVPRARMPFRLVAYDSDDRVIGISTPPTGQKGPSPAAGRARPLLHAVSSDGATAELSIGRSTSGGSCMYVRYKTDRATGVSEGCREPTRSGPALQLGSMSFPTQFLMGRVRTDVEKIEVRFADGARVTIEPTRGFVLYGVPASHVRAGHELIGAVARDGDGRKIGSQSFRRHTR